LRKILFETAYGSLPKRQMKYAGAIRVCSILCNKEARMTPAHPNRPSYLFTLRLWREEAAAGELEWRGRICDATTGDVRYFREWASLIPLLLAMLRDAEQQPQEPTHE
jgi:hypothetical protein